MKNVYKISALVLIVIAFVLIIVQSTEKKTQISIGAVIPQTGFGEYWGEPVLAGIKLAESDLKSKYGESRVSVFVEDGQSAVPASVSAAQKLLNINKVNAIYTEFSGPSNGISPIVKNAGKAFAYSTFNQKVVEDNEYSIKTFINFEEGCEKFVKYVNDSSKKILIISSLGNVAPYCEKALLKFFPRENVRVVDGFVGTDFRTVLLQNKSFAPDYIIPMMYEDGSLALIKQKSELGIKSIIYSYKQDSATEKILKELPTAYTDGSLYFEVEIDENFANKIKAINPNMTEDDMQGAANSYQSIMILGNALAQCPDGSAECVVSNIASQKNLESAGYKNASIVNRVLVSDLKIGEVKNGVGVLK